MTSRLSVQAVNALTAAEFVRVFGGVLEHSPRYAERVALRRPFDTAERLATAFSEELLRDDPAAQLALIRSHPDLAGKAALAGDLTRESASEQASAGLNRLSPEEYAEFHRINAAYHAKFDTPYVVCVRDHTKQSILAGAAERLEHTPDQERAAALQEIGRIARYRILDVLQEDEGGPG